MAKRRMFSVEIVESDVFCSLSPSAQALYIHLGMNADDEGFVDKWKSVLRSLKIKRAVLDSLIGAGYVLEFSSGVLLIADWTRHNKIRADRFTESAYASLLETLDVLENGRYIKASEDFLATQYR